MGKFDGFKVISADYKKVAGQGIAVDLLIPSKLTAGLYPVIVRFHGGGYVSGYKSRIVNAQYTPGLNADENLRSVDLVCTSPGFRNGFWT
jgi:hypothetical protein